jgi:hypothetical protein
VPQIRMRNSTSQSDDGRRWGLWEVLATCTWVDPLWIGLAPLKEEEEIGSLCSSCEDTARRQSASCDPDMDPIRHRSAGALVWTPRLQNFESRFQLLKSPSWWHLAAASPMDCDRVK